jgi:hypothetical protein
MGGGKRTLIPVLFAARSMKATMDRAYDAGSGTPPPFGCMVNGAMALVGNATNQKT